MSDHAPLNLDAPLVLSRSLVIQALAFDRFAAKASLSSSAGVSLDGATLALLSCFTTPKTPRQARSIYESRFTPTDALYEQTLTQLVAAGMLAPPGERRPIEASEYSSVLTHHPMLQDTVRLDAYRVAIERHARGKRVLEIGCGTGVLSMFAAKAGARSVTAVEESSVIELARDLIEASGLSEQITLVPGNSRDVRLPERAEVLIHELIGHEPLAENAIHFLEDARARLLVPDARLIPDQIEVWCRAVTRAGWTDPLRMAREADELGRRYGVDFGPYRARLERLPRLPTFRMSLDEAPGGARTADALLHRADFSAADRVDVTAPAEIELTVERGGTLTTVVTWFRARMDEGVWLTNAPDAPATHWALAVYDLAEPRVVEAGDTVAVRATVETLEGLERTLIELVE